MKPFKFTVSRFAAVIFLAALSGSAPAQNIAYDDAGNYLVSANWTNGSNKGFGFTPWAILTTGPNSHGNYVGSANVPAFVIASTTNVTGTNYTDIWGIYANGNTDVNLTTACRGFSSPLGTNTFKLQWGSRGAGSTTTTNGGVVHGWSGFTLRNGNTVGAATDFQTGARFYIYFLDGASPSTIYIQDGSNDGFQVSLTGTSFSDLGRQNITNALQVEITPAADSLHYHMVVKDVVRNKTLYTLDSIFAGNPGDTVDSVAMFCRETTGDQIYNRMQIAPPTLLPPSFSNVAPTNGAIYLNAGATTLAFEVDSFNSTVTSNFVNVFLNGVVQGSLSYNTTAPTNQLIGTCTAPLTANTFYNYTITAQDANGNIATNTGTFNTFLPTDLYIDAADYNYANGLFVDSPTPSDAYANLLGVQGVDYFISDTAGTNNQAGYRPGDLPQALTLATDATGDLVDHAGLRLNGGTAYNIGFTDTGNWENYTRTYPVATNYSIYARAASVTGGPFEIDLLVNPSATTSNQPLAAIGRVNVPVTPGSKIFTGQLTPLTDLFGNTVLIPLSGTMTLRTTAVASRVYNLEYFVVVPVVNATTLRPYISVASPIPNAAGVLLDARVSFTVANRQTTATNIQLLVNGSTITNGIISSSNAVGTVVTYTPTMFLPSNATNTISVIITDSTSNKTTNNWAFTTINASNVVIPTAYAQPINSGTTNGFGLSLFKIPDSAPVVLTLSNAWRELAGLIIDVNSGTPYLNLATNAAGSNFYLETNTITYDITGAASGAFTFSNRSTFPNVPAGATENNFVFQALTYLQLTNGNYHLVVRSDDGFELTAGATPADTNLVLGLFDLGRANTTPSDIYITVQTNGLYPMSLFYVQETGGGNIEFYSIVNGNPILINDQTNPNSIKAFASLTTPATPVAILNPAHITGTTTFSFVTQSGHNHFVEYKNLLTDATWTPLTTIAGSGSSTNVMDNTAGGDIRFYRIRTQ